MATFKRDVLDESRNRPVLVDFWAPWCGPCRQLTPILEKVVRAAKGKVRLAKMNIDEHPQVAGQLGIQSIPAVVAFVGGQGVDGFMGALPESQVQGFIDRLAKGVPGAPDVKELLAAADQALIDGDAAGAAEIYAAVLGEDQENAHAIAGMARCQLEAGSLEQAKAVLAAVPAAKANDPAVAAARAAIEVAEQAASLGPLAELEQKIAADPKDFQSRFDLAVGLAAKGRRKEALDHLIEIVRRDRKWNDDGARKQLVQFFEVWGPTDELTIEGRKRLSSLLFA
jgi:putative thioredoxin